MPSQRWARNFTVNDDDIDYLTSLLLERETPLSTEELASALIEYRLSLEEAALNQRYQDVRPYNPSHSYQVGQRVIFPLLEHAVAVVKDIRAGENPEYGDFSVIAVEFEGEASRKGRRREFAADLTVPHKLSQQEAISVKLMAGLADFTAADVLAAAHDEIVDAIDKALGDAPELVKVTGKWFPRALLLEVNEGHLHLAEAVLDLAGGGPHTAQQILDEIGGLGKASKELQTFSMNYALNYDSRFDEVGPAGQVLWYLARLEPPEVIETPPMLRYTPIDYDRSSLTPDMLALEAEIDDEHSPIDRPAALGDSSTVTLIYPHRRVGTLPLNAGIRRIFPTARRAPRIWVTLVDGQDGEEFTGWVVHKDRYVFGLSTFYRKHRPPVGAYITVKPGDEPGKIIVDLRLHSPRKEYIRLVTPRNSQISFENNKRAIAADYDDLMILGADDLQAVDALFQTAQQRKSLVSVLRMLMTELSRLTPQGTVHFKTLYSAINVVRRCPPGPIFVALMNDPDFEQVGNHYWKLSSN